MNKKLMITLFILISTVLVVNCTETKSTKEDIKQRIVKSLVYIRGLNHMASGVVIKSDEMGSLILTNKHVCEPHKLSENVKSFLGGIPSYIQLIAYNKSIAIAQPMKVAINSDLCLLHTTQTNLTPVKIAKIPVKLSEKVHTCGNPYAVESMCYTGYASKYVPIFFMLYRLTSLPARPGQSGSGVFNNNTELVGLISLGDSDGTFSAMVPLAHIKLFLAGIEL